jgi:tetratricopeptide (TPR) repeat protein
MDKHLGIQPRWSKNKRKAVRKRSEIDPEKYNQLVEADENEVEHEYKSAYRGQVQNKAVEANFMPMYELSYIQYNNGIKSYQAFDHDVEDFNTHQKPQSKIYVNCNPAQLTEVQSKAYFVKIDTLSSSIAAAKDVRNIKGVLLQRAVAYCVVQNYDAAINDLTAYLQIDSTSVMAYWERAVCQTMMNDFNASNGVDVKLKMMKAKEDLDSAIKLSPKNAYLFFNRGNIYATQKEYTNAIDDYNKAIQLDGNLAEAYYNRGIAYCKNGDKTSGIRDLSRAGELGIYEAYSVIKQFSKSK